MKIKRLTTLFFSPTGSTKRIVESVEKGIEAEEKRKIDITYFKERENFNLKIDKDELLIIGIPVYAGRIPDFIIPVLKKLQGNGQFAVLISVYGNVTEGTILKQLKDLMENRGFKIASAASFIGKHTFSTDKLRIAEKRPDKSDCQKAESFGKDIQRKLEKLKDDKSFSSISVKDKNEYLLDNLPMPQYVSKNFIKKPDVNLDICIDCKICAEMCPVNAIDRESLKIDNDSCIRCMSCVKNCPKNAREIKYKRFFLFKTFLNLYNISKRKEPKKYI